MCSSNWLRRPLTATIYFSQSVGITTIDLSGGVMTASSIASHSSRAAGAKDKVVHAGIFDDQTRRSDMLKRRETRIRYLDCGV